MLQLHTSHKYMSLETVEVMMKDITNHALPYNICICIKEVKILSLQLQHP